ncbi:MAG: D-arabinono-1,4-lactone oxidase [Caldilineaceae bacterium]
MTDTWSNWSGSVTCTPQRIAMPASEAEVVALIKQAALEQISVRVAGTGHSFTPLCASNALLVSLDGLQGLTPSPALPQLGGGSVAPADDSLPNLGRTREGYATFGAGTKLHQMGDPLWDAGLAMANMGDIDRQALAGAVSTGTHGTGPTLGSISTQAVGLRLLLASGEIVDCSAAQETELFKAAQVSLGALGIITQVTLRCLPAYRLHERTWVAGFDECMSQLDTLIANNRHFEFFWVPSEDVCAMKTLNPTTTETLESPNGAERPLCDQPSVTGRLARYVREEKIDRSYRIFPSERNLKFNETEFAVPAASGPDCLREIRQLMQRRYPAVLWPIEYRTLAADDIPLSPAYGRATVTISVHQAAELPYQPFFADVEAIFRNHQGRPHWGKIHTNTARELTELYPAWGDFQAVRAQVDPTGLFLNEHLRTILIVA